MSSYQSLFLPPRFGQISVFCFRDIQMTFITCFVITNFPRQMRAFKSMNMGEIKGHLWDLKHVLHVHIGMTIWKLCNKLLIFLFGLVQLFLLLRVFRAFNNILETFFYDCFGGIFFFRFKFLLILIYIFSFNKHK